MATTAAPTTISPRSGTYSDSNTGIWSWLTTVDHKRIGTLYLYTALSFFIIQDFPDTARFLSDAERTVVVRRLQQDDQFSAGGEELKWKYIWKSIFDWKTWVGSEYFIIYALTFALYA